MPSIHWRWRWMALAELGLAGWLLSCASVSIPPSAGAVHPAQIPFPRSAASCADEFLLKQNGADFAADLPHNRCDVDGTQARLAPDWKLGTAHALDAAAYALYRLSLDAAATATLQLEWVDTEPAACWIGLADWDRQLWHWELLPTGGELEIAEPARFSTPEQHCIVAVVVLGESKPILASVGLSDIRPPLRTGYTLFAPWPDTHTYLIDMNGHVAHMWDSPSTVGLNVDLLPDGHLLRQRMLENSSFTLGGLGGRIEEYNWDGNMMWYFELSNEHQSTHHDFEPLPNGNILLTVWNIYGIDALAAMGRDPATIVGNGMLIDSIIEIQPLPGSGADIVWEWKATEHLIQDFDAAKPNYGDPAAHPELIDLNYSSVMPEDWLHTNSVAYNAELDQIMLSVLGFSEIWIIDHSTIAEEVRGHTGGRCGRGGDLIYRWGNPQAYGRGDRVSRMLIGQHDAQWIAADCPGAGNITVFNNHAGIRVSQQFSTVIEIVPPLNPDGTYGLFDGVYGPAEPVWTYTARTPTDLFGNIFSSAQRLPNGDTLICEGDEGRFSQVDSCNEIIWTYDNLLPTGGPLSVFRAKRYPANYPGVAAL